MKLTDGYADLEKLRAKRRRYKTSEKGKAAARKYKASAGGIVANCRYKSGATGREATRRYKKGENGRCAASRQRQAYVLRNPEKVAAHTVMKNAIRTGRITRGSCGICGSENAHAHHADYSKPLEIEWLCRAHHVERHQP